MKLFLLRAAALGNGTREAGSFIGESTAESMDQMNLDNVTLEADWTNEELRNLLRNPELMSNVPPQSIDLDLLASVPDGGSATTSDPDHSRDEDEMDPEFAAYLASFSIKEIPDLSEKEFALLVQFENVLQLYQFGEQNQGLESLPGMNKKAQKVIYAAVGKLISSFDASRSAGEGSEERPEPDGNDASAGELDKSAADPAINSSPGEGNQPAAT